MCYCVEPSSAPAGYEFVDAVGVDVLFVVQDELLQQVPAAAMLNAL